MLIYISSFTICSAQFYHTQNCQEAKVENGFLYVPLSPSKDSVDRFQLPSRYDSSFKAPKTIEFYWISPCNDGYYELNVTPRQLYFSSSHENPNPNFLFWAMDINPLLYQSLKKALMDTTPAGFAHGYRPFLYYDSSFKTSVTIPEIWNDSNE